MKLLILNGIPDNPSYLPLEKEIEAQLASTREHEIDYFKLRELNIHYCTGCWDCWVKTPGLCAIKDDQAQILAKFPHSDRLLFISPVLVGYESALLKKTKDRIIPTAHPYIEMVHGEQHHRQRYAKSPDFGVLLLKDENTTQEDLNLIRETYDRVGLNFRSKILTFDAVDTQGGIENAITHFKR